jgi:hypothetical protein
MGSKNTCVLLVAVPHARQNLCVQGEVDYEGVIVGFGDGLRSGNRRVMSGSPLTGSSVMLPVGMSPSSTTQAVSASVVGSYPATGVSDIRLWQGLLLYHLLLSKQPQSPPLRSMHFAWKQRCCLGTGAAPRDLAEVADVDAGQVQR